MKLPSPLYVILDRRSPGSADLGFAARGDPRGGCRLVQLGTSTHPWPSSTRSPGLSASAADRPAPLHRQRPGRSCPRRGRGGLHVGQDDLPAAAARRILPAGMVLGVSTHDPEQPAPRRGARGWERTTFAVGSIFRPDQGGVPARRS
jgi:thiamine-phosphate pyrophosphorylase